MPSPAAHAATSRHVDCSADADGNGTLSSPYNNLAAINAVVLHPGDQVLFKRGTRCAGGFRPQGSGVAGSPIVADAIGLHNQQYWELRNIELPTPRRTPSTARASRSG
ncbi:hypothetical protein [Planotetraspora sp. GP83]|uniref:hypothetical protein n=1 Tax=Planotetraspora sp. GP83 TaxID=3156264 RepID=UPI0035154E96